MNLHAPAVAGAMVGIIGLLAQCKLLEAEERDPQQWYKRTSARLRDASTSIKEEAWDLALAYCPPSCTL